MAWEDYRSGVWSDIYAIHLRENGSRANNGWNNNGNIVCGATHKQNLPKLDLLMTGRDAGVALVWEDKRATGKEELANTFVQLLNDHTVQNAPPIERSAHPLGYELQSVHPNPFNSQTVITFVTPREGNIELSVFDISGRFIADLGSGFRSAGRHIAILDGTDIAAGTYVVQMKVDDIRLQRRIQLLK